MSLQIDVIREELRKRVLELADENFKFDEYRLEQHAGHLQRHRAGKEITDCFYFTATVVGNFYEGKINDEKDDEIMSKFCRCIIKALTRVGNKNEKLPGIFVEKYNGGGACDLPSLRSIIMGYTNRKQSDTLINKIFSTAEKDTTHERFTVAVVHIDGLQMVALVDGVTPLSMYLYFVIR